MSFNLGIDVGGTKVLLGVVDKDGEVGKQVGIIKDGEPIFL